MHHSCQVLVINLFLNQNIYCGYSKESSQRDGSFEQPNNVKTDEKTKYSQVYN